MKSVAIVGCGLIGRGWAVCFARAGLEVRIWDPDRNAAAAAAGLIAQMLEDLAAANLIHDETPAGIARRITVSDHLAEAVAGAIHVQECAPERLDLKRSLFAEMDGLAACDTIVASSASALMASTFTDHLDGRARCLVAHPVNPPHLVPLVEIVPAPWTAPDTVERTCALMSEAGQKPVRLGREIDGFLLNRLQAAVLDEAFRLVADGYADADAIDTCMRDGLAMRWSFMGPFETIDLNAPGGVRDYVERYQPMFRRLTDSMRVSADWSGPVLQRIEAQRRERSSEADLPGRQIWRDRKLMELAAFRQEQDCAPSQMTRKT